MFRQDPGNDGRQPAAHVLDRTGVGTADLDPSFLDGIVRLGDRAEHPIRDRPEATPFGLESLGQLCLFVHRSHSLRRMGSYT